MFIDSPELVPLLLVAAKGLAMVTCGLFLISGVDDLFIDVYFVLLYLRRRHGNNRRPLSLTEAELLQGDEQAIAVMIPAWDEEAVIRKMLEHAVNTVKYRNVDFFIGTYPNDPGTQREVQRVADRLPNVHLIVNSSNGPTSKADCLNEIYLGIRNFERARNRQFQIFVQEDCEDVVHPLCFKLFNFFMPAYDMVQLPVHSLRRKWYEFTGGHYIDEFAQLHVKDLVVRSAFSGVLPTAGVGVAFSRRAFAALALSHRCELFRTNSLTEDYDIGFRLGKAGLNQLFARVILSDDKDHQQQHQLGHLVDGRLICVKEYFPNRFRAAVRQKSRWVMGIALQGWASLGWPGNWRNKYMLLRDRKVLVTNLVNMLGYIVAAVVLTVWLTLWLDPETYRYPPLLERGSWLWYLVLVNAVLLCLRLVARSACVQVLYGWSEAFWSLPRMFWGNIINFFATCRAIGIYAVYLVNGKTIAWDKTTHIYPDEDEIQSAQTCLQKSTASMK